MTTGSVAERDRGAEDGRPPARPPLPRNVKVLSLVSFFQDAASELVYPVTPLFVTRVLGAPPAVLGLIEGVAEATAALMKIVSGRLADRRRRKPMIAAGYGLSSAMKPLIAAATGWGLVLAARFGDRFGKGLRTSPRDALIAVDVAPEQRGRAFGLHRAADTAGAVVGPLLGLALYELLDHRLRLLFLAAAVPGFVSVVLIRLVREARAEPDVPAIAAEAEAEAHAPAASAAAASAPAASAPTKAHPALPRRYWRVVAFLTVFGLVNFSDAFIILRASDLGLGFVAIVLAYALYNTSYALFSYPAGVISDRLPRRFVFAVGLGAFAVAYVGLGAAPSGWWVWWLLPVYGTYTALTDGIGKAWIADLTPRPRLGAGLGYYQGLTGATALLAGVWAGLAWHGTGSVPLLVSGAIAGALAVTLALAGGRLERER